MYKVKNVTITIIFEGSALNKDEKIAENIHSIKRLSVNGEERSYISRPAMRHYLFNTLNRSYPNDWKKASVRINNNVVQFDLTKDNIFTTAELDAFGYMCSFGKNTTSITRKGTVGITKAISLINYNQDMAFYANHDMVERARNEYPEAQPNPRQSQENMTLYKATFTIDSEMLGRDTWIVDSFDFEKQNDKLILKKIIPIENKNKGKSKNKEEKEEKEEKLEINTKGFTIIIIRKDGSYIHHSSTQQQGHKGTIRITELDNGKFKIEFELSDYEKKKRICQILSAIKNGLIAKSSGEVNTIVPLFIIAAPVKIPSPIFHSYIDVKIQNGSINIIGIRDCLNNGWINGDVYLYFAERLGKPTIEKVNYIWEDFLKNCNLDLDSCNK